MGLFDIPTQDEKAAYAAGLDCARNGANTTNCHFSYFARPELTRAWEKGKKDGAHQANGGGDA